MLSILVRRGNSGFREAGERGMWQQPGTEKVQIQLRNVEDFQKLLEAGRKRGVL